MKKKVCTYCHEEKPISEFYQTLRKGTDYIHTQSRCIDCLKIVKKLRRADPALRKRELKLARAWYKRQDKTKMSLSNRRYNIQNIFGISFSKYKFLVKKHKGVCAICQKPETAMFKGKLKALSIDHCHASGTIRGLLCHKCNTLLGCAQDNPDVLARALHYLLTAPNHIKRKVV